MIIVWLIFNFRQNNDQLLDGFEKKRIFETIRKEMLKNYSATHENKFSLPFVKCWSSLHKVSCSGQSPSGKCCNQDQK